MLRQLLVGTAVSVCNIAIHALVMATVVQLSSRMAETKDKVRQSRRLTTVMIATVSTATVPVLMAAHFLEVMCPKLTGFRRREFAQTHSFGSPMIAAPRWQVDTRHPLRGVPACAVALPICRQQSYGKNGAGRGYIWVYPQTTK